MIYFDNAATTPVSDISKRAIIEALDIFGNPSSQYDLGKCSKKLLEDARNDVANALGVKNNTIVFTGSGSEADTFAIHAGWWHGRKRGRNKIIISTVEHHAITHAAEQLKLLGAEIVYVNVDSNGAVDLKDLKNKIDTQTALVSIMASNNEVGTTMDLFTIYQMAHRFGALFHTDAVQGITHLNIPSVCFDMMSISGHKFGAPKGVGAICINSFLKDDLKDFFLIAGGKQEFGMRGGTENVPYIVGLATALKEHKEHMDEHIATEITLHDYLLEQLMKEFPYVKINGMSDATRKNPGVLNFSIGFADAASVVEWMNLHDICISSGSACNTGSPKPSHVLMAMYNDEQRAFSSVRVSLSYRNTKEEIDAFIEALKAFERVYKH